MRRAPSRPGGSNAPSRQRASDLPTPAHWRAEAWHAGNALREGAPTRGWFIGPFLDPDAGIRATPELELKWAEPRAGDQRPRPVTDETRTTVLLLITGSCRIELNSESFVLSLPGDYLMWGPGIDHTWEIVENSTILTVRWWPSGNT